MLYYQDRLNEAKSNKYQDESKAKEEEVLERKRTAAIPAFLSLHLPSPGDTFSQNP